MKFPKLITRRRFKCTVLAAASCMAVVMLASYWYWPCYIWRGPTSPFERGVSIGPGYFCAQWWWIGKREDLDRYRSLTLERRSEYRAAGLSAFHPTVWLPSFERDRQNPSDVRTVLVPLWIPLVLCAIPTGILFYRDRKPKPGCCAQCRYDLTGLNGGTCPECGTKIATTGSHKAPASAAEGEPDVAGGENGVGVEGNEVS